MGQLSLPHSPNTLTLSAVSWACDMRTGPPRAPPGGCGVQVGGTGLPHSPFWLFRPGRFLTCSFPALGPHPFTAQSGQGGKVK